MNPEQILNSVEICIAERPKLDAKIWVVCWHEERLKCLPVQTVKNDGNIFGRFTIDDLEKGLTFEMWSEIAKKIVLFFERGKKCQIPKEPTLIREQLHLKP